MARPRAASTGVAGSATAFATSDTEGANCYATRYADLREQFCTPDCDTAVAVDLGLVKDSTDAAMLRGRGPFETTMSFGGRDVPRTVNGTGHTGPSEFCATSI